MSDVNHCPFCLSKNVRLNGDVNGNGFVLCYDCGCSGPYKLPGNKIFQWNAPTNALRLQEILLESVYIDAEKYKQALALIIDAREKYFLGETSEIKMQASDEFHCALKHAEKLLKENNNGNKR